ncbi:MAG: Fur family transcriptional regulator [Ilumatobacter sp.]|uniref:Fur family transcriptional regulator n=1 Tax=Ilumatobacter sp. TaxID=1967498 RepID=UPI003297E833
MKDTIDPTESLDRAIGVLRERGERVTTARRGVLAILASTTEHLSAERIYDEVVDRAPDVHRATVYRTLDSLVNVGVVAHVHLPHGPAAYHLLDSGARPHIHLVCRECKSVIDTSADLLDGAAASVLETIGFELDPDHVALTGWCAHCRSEARA